MKIVPFPSQPRPQTLRERLAFAEAQVVELKQALALSCEMMPDCTYELFRARLERERLVSSASNTSFTASVPSEVLMGSSG